MFPHSVRNSSLTSWPPHIFLCALHLLYFSTSGSLFWCFSLINSSNKPRLTKDIIKTQQVHHTYCCRTVHTCHSSRPRRASATPRGCQAQEPPHALTAGPSLTSQIIKKQNSIGRCQLTSQKYLVNQAKHKQTSQKHPRTIFFFFYLSNRERRQSSSWNQHQHSRTFSSYFLTKCITVHQWQSILTDTGCGPKEQLSTRSQQDPQRQGGWMRPCLPSTSCPHLWRRAGKLSQRWSLPPEGKNAFVDSLPSWLCNEMLSLTLNTCCSTPINHCARCTSPQTPVAPLVSRLRESWFSFFLWSLKQYNKTLLQTSALWIVL